MNEYKNSYFSLFCATTNTIKNLESILKEFDMQDALFKSLQKEIKALNLAQQHSEELFISN